MRDTNINTSMLCCLMIKWYPKCNDKNIFPRCTREGSWVVFEQELKGRTEEAWEVEKESMIILSKKRTGNFSQCYAYLTYFSKQTFSDFPLHTAHIIYLQELDKYFCMAVYPPLIARLWVTYLDDVLSCYPPKAQERSSKTHFYHTIPWSKSCNGFLLFPGINPCFVDFSPQMPCLCLPFVHILPLLQILFSYYYISLCLSKILSTFQNPPLK